MESLREILAKRKGNPTPPEGFRSLPIREAVRNTRAVIDNEYFSNGYAAFFGPKVTSVYLLLAKYANQQTQTCYPGVTLISKESGVKRRNSVIDSLIILEAYQLIVINHSTGGKGSNYYALLKHDVWKTIGSINIKELISASKAVSKRRVSDYQFSRCNSINGDTGNQLNKSVKEVNNTDFNIPLRGKTREEVKHELEATIFRGKK